MQPIPIRTTVIGSYPFPGWLEFAFNVVGAARPTVITPLRFGDEAQGDLTNYDCVFVCDVPALPSDHPPTLFLHGQQDLTVPIGTMWPYQMKLDGQGTETSTEISDTAGHEWLEAAVTRVPAWFNAHP